MRVEAHLHISKARKGENACISVRDLPNGKVRCAGFLILHKVTFPVQPAGRKKAVETGVKNVHAFIRGILDTEFDFGFPDHDWITSVGWREVSYRPQVGHFFDVLTHAPITQSESVMMVSNRLYYK